jgi:hypothetical protein
MGSRSRRRAARARTRPGLPPTVLTVGLRMMSELLTDVAAPLLASLKLPDNEPEIRVAITLAAALWNVSLIRDDALRARSLEDCRRLSAPVMPAEWDELLDEVVERARRLYPGEDREIIGVEIDVEGTRCDIRVLSSV